MDKFRDYPSRKILEGLDDSAESQKTRAIQSLSAFDRKQSTRKGHNPYALAQYLRAADGLKQDIEEGLTVEEAIENNFFGVLADRLAKHLGATN